MASARSSAFTWWTMAARRTWCSAPSRLPAQPCSSASSSRARLGEGVERRDVIALMALLFAASWIVAWLVPTLTVIAVCYVISRIGTGLFLFNLYNYTAVAYPTRIRSVAFAWTDGLGHLGAWGGVTLLGPLYLLGPNHLGWILWIILPGALLPAVLIRGPGHQSRHCPCWCWNRCRVRRREETDESYQPPWRLTLGDLARAVCVMTGAKAGHRTAFLRYARCKSWVAGLRSICAEPKACHVADASAISPSLVSVRATRWPLGVMVREGAPSTTSLPAPGEDVDGPPPRTMTQMAPFTLNLSWLFLGGSSDAPLPPYGALRADVAASLRRGTSAFVMI